MIKRVVSIEFIDFHSFLSILIVCFGFFYSETGIKRISGHPLLSGHYLVSLNFFPMFTVK